MNALYEWTQELALMAKVADQVTTDILGRPIVDMNDAPLVSRAFVARTKMSADLEMDVGLDSRIGWQSTASAVWRRSGGPRFQISESVAASLVLTKQEGTPVRLPFDAVLIHLPVGYMPSPVAGEYEGMMLVVRLPAPSTKFYTVNYVVRPEGQSGCRVMFFDDDVSEDEAKCVLSDSDAAKMVGLASQESISIRGILPTTEKHSDNAATMTLRIVRNLSSWLNAFPIRPSAKKNKVVVNAGEVGASVAHREMIYLRTEVQLDREIRSAARRLVNASASFETRKLAMRQVVRGHWKGQATKKGRKTIWIAPYWRGPDGPAAWGRVYALKQPPGDAP